MKSRTYQINNSIEMLKPFLFQNHRIHIILKMSIVKWNPYAVQAKRGKEFCIRGSEEVGEESIEEEGVVGGAEDF